MARFLLALACLAVSCDAFMVQPAAAVALRTPAASAVASPMMMLGKSGATAKKPLKKKLVKKAVKKPLKKKVKKAPAPRTSKGGVNYAMVKSPDTEGKIPLIDWAGQAVGLLGLDNKALLGVGVWGLLVLRFTIFYGFFGDADL